ncbi:tRNA dihydrouridine(20/20a) synthase DusA [Wenzhouxiangella marina]|uniref:tRNA-dihydrouridine(20/20a) synthase n=1 Tax=Wenzhouxiangella marina TaxID=1579979 RepID=A0A0K0XUR9_9GAMM|nr:tRNA dihydrouridine(20/20a) synthase DusA [Wenzhouxiangella marina]AKS41428.1 tRNA-dihydrouridine synthase [Wenzhouxiangella marina]MBB6086818.1 tRNA-dihydrouridine synthase A [Wenzhouxiangella marina]
MTYSIRLSVAPMMDWTDRHCRYFHRQINGDALLYTEMVTTGAILHGDRERLLGFDEAEHPVALQLGGSEVDDLALASRIAIDWGYDELNLNVGCPSDRVQKGRFGACLMKEPALVRDLLAAMRGAGDRPVTLKTRIGVDELDDEAHFSAFIDRVLESGIDTVIVHARKAWLSGLSPKQNREVPPLDYPRVHRLKARLPELKVVINGGIVDPDSAMQQLVDLDGVMLGRAAYQDPWILAEVGARLGQRVASSRREVVERMADYAEAHLARGGRLQQVARHMLGLFHSRPGARAWRQRLSQNMHLDGAGPELLIEACPES